MKTKIVLSIIFIMAIFVNTVFVSTVFAADRVSLGFLYGISNQVELVDRTNGAINQVSPTCLNLSSKGNLVVTSELSHSFVEEMHARGIKVTPFLSNHWSRSKGRAAIKNAEKLSDDIINVINEYNLDGVNVDIENLTSEDRDLLSEFVRILSEKMPENKMLTVSVAANPKASEGGWQGSYDYAKLGEYSDYLFVMTYDEHSQGGACGPVSSYDFVEESIKYTLQYVSKDKIVIGIPLYGRYWKNGAETGGEAVVIGAIPNIISRNSTIAKYDEKIGEAYVDFTVYADGVKTKINGVELEEGSYRIWYPNDESIKSKLDLVNKYDLLGAGVWALGQEKVNVWEYYKNELNKVPYISVEEKAAAEKEEERLNQKREKYEALVVEKSKLEELDIFPLENEMFEALTVETLEDAAKNNKNMQILEKVINSVNKTETHEALSASTEKVVDKKKNNKIENKTKRIHIYRFCRKENLKWKK